MKPKPYCSAAMTAMLKRVAAGGVSYEGAPNRIQWMAFNDLKSRGWLDRDGEITEAGRARIMLISC